jgi:ribosomal-protein-alanine N-acetyltransferase
MYINFSIFYRNFRFLTKEKNYGIISVKIRSSDMRIETKRLIITSFTIDMAEAVHLGSLDKSTRLFVPDEVFETVDDARDTLEYLISVYEGGEGPLVYPILLDSEYIGYVQAVPMDEGRWEIGYHINEQHRNFGYATEALTAFLPIIMKQLGISSILGITMEANKASQRVLEKCAFKKFFEGDDMYHGEIQPVVKLSYEI